MNTAPLLSQREHLAIRELLPFFVNETLSEHESARVGRHLASCASCSQEVDEQRHLAAQLRDSPEREGDPHAAWLRIEQKLQSKSTALHAPVLGRLRNHEWGLAAAVAVALMIPIAGYFWAQRPAAYRTVTSSPSVPVEIDGAIRAVFAPQTTLRDIEGLLEDTRYQIVSGPSPRGVYTLAPVVRDVDTLDAALVALRASPLVALAEPLVVNVETP